VSVFVGVPVKNCAFWLPRFLQQLDKLSDISRVVIIFGDSVDPTFDVVTQWMTITEHDVELYREPKNMRAQTSAQIGAIYRDFQQLVDEGSERHVLLLDADIMTIPRNLIQKLMKYDKDIMAPYIWIKDHVPPRFYDCHVFRVGGYRFHPFSPPMNNNELIKLDSAGTCLLVKRRPFLEVPYKNIWPHMMFCRDARIQGYEVWADPKTTVEHLDLTRLGIFHFPFESPEIGPDLTPFIKDDGSLTTTEAQLDEEVARALIWGTH